MGTEITAGKLSRLWKSAKDGSYHLLAPPLALLLFIGLQQIPFFLGIENKLIDIRFQLRQKYDPPASKDLILVSADELSIRNIGFWPWPRNVHGTFVELLKQVEPAVISWDILFTEPKVEEDKIFAKAIAGIAGSTPVVLAANMDDDPRPSAILPTSPASPFPSPKSPAISPRSITRTPPRSSPSPPSPTSPTPASPMPIPIPPTACGAGSPSSSASETSFTPASSRRP